MHVPVSMRTVAHLRARAEELRRMALTARTAQSVSALVTLADRFEALARRRSAECGVDHQRTTSNGTDAGR